MLQSTELSAMISGGVYRDGYRPRDSKLEDIIVIFTNGEVGEVEIGTVTINIYVPDIAIGQINGAASPFPITSGIKTGLPRIEFLYV